MKRFKKIFTVWLSLVFIFNLAGYYLAFPVVSWCFKATVRSGMEAGLFKRNLVTVKIPGSVVSAPGSAFQKTGEDEFRYLGRMYDVASETMSADTVYYYCYSDEDENRLMAGLDDHVKSDIQLNAPTGKKDNSSSLRQPLKEYLKAAPIVCIKNMTAREFGNGDICPYYLSVVSEIPGHPPEQPAYPVA